MNMDGFDKFQCHADISYDVYMGLLILGTASALAKQLGLHLAPKRNPTLCLRNCENFTSPSFCIMARLTHSSLVWCLSSLFRTFSSFKPVVVVQLLSCVQLFATSWTAAQPDFPVLDCLAEFAQTHVHWVGDAIQPSHSLLSPSPPALSFSQHQGPFQWVSSSQQVVKVVEIQLQQESFQWTSRVEFL